MTCSAATDQPPAPGRRHGGSRRPRCRRCLAQGGHPAHSPVGRLRSGAQAFRLLQTGQANPSGQRCWTRCWAQAALSESRAWNSWRDMGRSDVQQAGSTEQYVNIWRAAILGCSILGVRISLSVIAPLEAHDGTSRGELSLPLSPSPSLAGTAHTRSFRRSPRAWPSVRH